MRTFNKVYILVRRRGEATVNDSLELAQQVLGYYVYDPEILKDETLMVRHYESLQLKEILDPEQYNVSRIGDDEYWDCITVAHSNLKAECNILGISRGAPVHYKETRPVPNWQITESTSLMVSGLGTGFDATLFFFYGHQPIEKSARLLGANGGIFAIGLYAAEGDSFVVRDIADSVDERHRKGQVKLCS